MLTILLTSAPVSAGNASRTISNGKSIKPYFALAEEKLSKITHYGSRGASILDYTNAPLACLYAKRIWNKKALGRSSRLIVKHMVIPWKNKLPMRIIKYIIYKYVNQPAIKTAVLYRRAMFVCADGFFIF